MDSMMPMCTHHADEDILATLRRYPFSPMRISSRPREDILAKWRLYR